MVVALASLVLCTGMATEASGKLPRGLPAKLHLGSWDPLGGAKKLRQRAPFGFRYQYLTGGANTGRGWRFVTPNGSFVKRYVRESARSRMVPVFSYFQLRPSLPGAGLVDEPTAVRQNSENRATMRAYFEDLRYFFRRARATRRRIVLQVEPDVWGYGQQRATGRVDARSVPVVVSGTGLRELAGLPDTLAGFARAVHRLRDRYARRVLLGYHLSTWGTGVDLDRSNLPAASVSALAITAARFYRSLGTRFDVVFAELDNRDAGYRLKVFGDPGANWNGADFTRHTRFLRTFSRATKRRIVLTRIPVGNTKMRSVNNTFGHFQDNRVQTLLAPPKYRRLRAYRRAGVIALLFGGGVPGTTCACDFMRDGVTNPRPINGNRRRSRTRDDDGGFFRARARQYYRRGGPLGLRR